MSIAAGVIAERIPNRGASAFMRWLTKPPSKWWRRYNRLIKATMGHERTTRTFFGARMRCDLDDYIGIRIFHFGFWEPHVSAIVLNRLQPGDVFCDVGANIGYYSLLAAHAVGSGGRVVAIEPCPPIFRRLAKNVAYNKSGDVRTVEAAVSDCESSLPIFFGPRGNAGMATTVAARGHGPAGIVSARPLERILTPEERARLRLLKIDVEGAERPILRHLLDTIADYPSQMEIIVEMSVDPLAPGESDPNALLAEFIAAGFGAYVLANPYDIQSYVAFSEPILPVPLALPLRAQADVLLSRSGGSLE